MTKGVYAFDYGDTAKLTPLCKMETLGHDFIPPGIHAGGLRYHGMAPMVSHCHQLGLIEAVSVMQTDVFSAGVSASPAPRASSPPRRATTPSRRCGRSLRSASNPATRRPSSST